MSDNVSEEEYDEIMNEARKIFQKRWDEYEDPYAFHKAFEWAVRKLKKDNKRVIAKSGKEEIISKIKEGK